MPPSRFYPTLPQVSTPEALERTFRQTLTQQYTLTDRHDALAAKVNAPAASAPPTPNGPTNTKLLGLNVTPIDTNSTPYGSVPAFNPTSGQITFMQAATLVLPAPATDTSPGYPGQIAYDATHIYICVALNTWRRTTIGTF
jgi:hypothetical protein